MRFYDRYNENVVKSALVVEYPPTPSYNSRFLTLTRMHTNEARAFPLRSTKTMSVVLSVYCMRPFSYY